MADHKKEQERAELHRTIWGIANDLRGSVDGWDFKQYVLGMLFYRYISENLAGYINMGEWETGQSDFQYALLSDKEAEHARAELVETKGFFILPSELFQNVHSRAASDENLNETLEKVFKNIESSAQGADSEDDFRGLFDDIDVNSNKLGPTISKPTTYAASTCSCTISATINSTSATAIRWQTRCTGIMNRLRPSSPIPLTP